MEIGFHTDAFNSAYWSFEQCLEWAQGHRVHWIECGAIDGVTWIHGLGYYPHVALWEDPVLLRPEWNAMKWLFRKSTPLSRFRCPKAPASGSSTFSTQSAGQNWRDVLASIPPMTGTNRLT
jgi:hypothetical protein